MEGRWSDNIKELLLIYLLFFMGFSIKCNFKFEYKDMISIIIIGMIVTLIFINTYKMTIDTEYIKVYRIIGKNIKINIDEAYRIEIQSYAWQIRKSYTIVIFTNQKVYEVSDDIFDVNKLNVYLTNLCEEKGIEYDFNK